MRARSREPAVTPAYDSRAVWSELRAHLLARRQVSTHIAQRPGLDLNGRRARTGVGTGQAAAPPSLAPCAPAGPASRTPRARFPRPRAASGRRYPEGWRAVGGTDTG